MAQNRIYFASLCADELLETIRRAPRPVLDHNYGWRGPPLRSGDLVCLHFLQEARTSPPGSHFNISNRTTPLYGGLPPYSRRANPPRPNPVSGLFLDAPLDVLFHTSVCTVTRNNGKRTDSDRGRSEQRVVIIKRRQVVSWRRVGCRALI